MLWKMITSSTDKVSRISESMPAVDFIFFNLQIVCFPRELLRKSLKFIIHLCLEC